LKKILSGDQSSTEQAADAHKILVVEDDYFVGMELESALTEVGFVVVGIANSADEAVALATAERPVLAIMDIRLNGQRDGVDAALEIFSTLGIRSIFATAHHGAAVKARAEPAAPLGWLSKPYTMNSAVAAINVALAELKKP
jgi:DNA-binding NarL/FixJ family response regulator